MAEKWKEQKEQHRSKRFQGSGVGGMEQQGGNDEL